ncbi:hypothetical protein CR513_12800, partial [Mucuna pruriens]
MYGGSSEWKGKERDEDRPRKEKSPKIAFQCLNRVMIVKDDGEVKSGSSIGEVSTFSEAGGLSDDSHYERDLLVVRSEKGGSLVNRQVKVMFTLGRYENRVQFDKKVIHDGVTNQFTFIHLGQRVVLKPLSQREVHEDQKKMNVKGE